MFTKHYRLKDLKIQLHGHYNIIIDVVTSRRQYNIIPIIIFIIVKILLLCGHLYCILCIIINLLLIVTVLGNKYFYTTMLMLKT